MILFDETIRQRAADGTPFPHVLEQQGIIPGIKVDQGAKELALAPGETVTAGLDGLRERFAEYRELGARFAKWRAVIAIGDGIPSETCIWVNAHALARYAALAQEAGLVPIVEPEVLMDGDHDIARSYAVTSRVQHAVFTELHDQRVLLEGMLLKPNMVLSGYDCPEQASVDEVAEATVRCLRHNVPPPCPESSSSPAARATRPRPRTSTRSTASGRSRGSSRSRSAARSRARRCAPGAGEPANSPRRRRRICSGRG